MKKLYLLFLVLSITNCIAQKHTVTSIQRLIKVEDFTFAHAALNEFIALDSTDSKIYVYRAMCFRKETDFDNAFRDLDKALQLDNKNNEAYCELGVIYSLIQEKEKALQNFNRSLELNANYSPVYNAKGAYYFDLHNNDSLALKNYNKAITLDKSNFRAYCNRAELFNQQEKYKEAISDLNEAIKLFKIYHKAYFERAVAYYHINEFNKAISDFEKAQQYNESADAHESISPVDIYKWIGDCYEGKRDKKNADLYHDKAESMKMAKPYPGKK